MKQCPSGYGNEDPRAIIVRDFNPFLARRLLKMQGKSVEFASFTMDVVTSRKPLQTWGVFDVEIRSELPYVEFTSKEKFDYTMVLIDDQRLVGIKVRALVH